MEERRPGADTVPKAWSDVSDEVVVHLWDLWGAQERAQGRGWRGIARAVLAHAPFVAVRHCAYTLSDAVKSDSGSSGAPLKALVEFTASQRVANDDDTALVN